MTRYAFTLGAVLLLASCGGGGASDSTSTPEAPLDLEINSFNLEPHNNELLHSDVFSNIITVSGLSESAEVDVSLSSCTTFCQLKVNGEVVPSPSVAVNGTTVQVMLMAPAVASEEASAELRIAQLMSRFIVTAVSELDDSVDAYDLGAFNNAALGDSLESNEVMVSGLSDGVEVDVIFTSCSTTCQLQINDEVVLSPGKVANGDKVKILLTAPSEYSSQSLAELTIAQLTQTFTVTTMVTPDLQVDDYILGAVNGAEVNDVVASDEVSVTGLSDGVEVDVSLTSCSTSCQLKINGEVVSSPGKATNGAKVKVLLTASSEYISQASVELTIAQLSEVFTVTTMTDPLWLEYQPTALHFYNPAPYDFLELFWQDNAIAEVGYRIDKRAEGTSDWVSFGTAPADATSWSSDSYDRSGNTEDIRVVALFENDAISSDSIRLVGQDDSFEVYAELPDIRTPKIHSIDGISFPEISPQAPIDPSLGNAMQISTFFAIQVKELGTAQAFQTSPTYEVRPQLRIDLPVDDPMFSGGHNVYDYGLYGPNSNVSELRTVHQRHWSHFDASNDIVVRIELLETANLPGPIDLADLDVQPAPLKVEQISERVIELTLEADNDDYTKHYRIAMNRNAWSAAVPGRTGTIIESPLFININPMHHAPASAPEGEIKEYDGGKLVVFGSGIHLPNNTYARFGKLANDVAEEVFWPADSLFHSAFIIKDTSHPLKLWGRGMYTDMLYKAGADEENDTSRTPWAHTTPNGAMNNIWGLENPSWGARIYINDVTQKATVDGLVAVTRGMGHTVKDGVADILNLKSIGYAGATYQSGSVNDVLYRGTIMYNNDDTTYTHMNYRMEHCVTYNLHNGPSFQIGWAVNSNDAKSRVYDHTVFDSPRNKPTTPGSNHGVFNSRLQLGQLVHHQGGYYENMELWGKESIIFNVRIWNDDNRRGPNENLTSVLGDKTYKNFTVHQTPFIPNRFLSEVDIDRNNIGYIRFIHFDNLVLEGDLIDNIDERGFFEYDERTLQHTFTFFSLPKAIEAPIAGNAPIGKYITITASHNYAPILANVSLPVSLSPLTANSDNNLLALQQFAVVDAGDGYVALKAENGYYVKADPARYGYVYTEPDLLRGDLDTQGVTEDAKFIWIDNLDGSFSLYAKSMGLLVRTELNSGRELPLYAAHDVTDSQSSFMFSELGDVPDSELPVFIEPDISEGIKVLNHAASGNNLRYTAADGFTLSSDLGVDAQWQVEWTDSIYFRLIHVATGQVLGIENGDLKSIPSLFSNGSSGEDYEWSFSDEGEWGRLIHRASALRLHFHENGSQFELGPNEWTGSRTQWSIEEP
ncbi:hypothetical protein [Echinimonas agarilytica]|uniref:Uncharacterized protein n=1 Tax=Echinimonas agarilytica TaxID=1215918 RepID=A0AA41W4V6_9GAMM|nr:hypothetical protein [Echinimonas agarilytica]MCM2678719.1 hypothetical protein [Echinimonas agarilytica]